jgi:integrase
MSLRSIKVNGRKVWQARVAVEGFRKSTIRPTKDEARQAEADLLRELREKAGQEAQAGAAPATMRKLFEFYAEDMKNRGKGEGSQERVEYTALAVETIAPELLNKAVGAITDGDIFAFRNGRRRSGTKPSTINRDLRTIRAALKLARPEYRFPGGAFFKEDETRVRWLRPDEELLVIEPMASPFREIAKLAALTLMRMSEIRTLRPEYVHLEQGVVMLPEAKAGTRPVMLSAAARKILAGQLEGPVKDCWCDGQERPHHHVFPGPEGRPCSREQIGKAFRRRRGLPGSRTSTSTTYATTEPRWR